jgi:fructose-1,6-bisphosphatase I
MVKSMGAADCTTLGGGADDSGAAVAVAPRSPLTDLVLSMPIRHDFSENLMSLQSHILLEETKHPSASGDFTWIVSAISLAAKSIANHVRRARLSGAIGNFGDVNVQGEEQQKLDVIANEALMRCLGTRASVAVLASEEDDEPTILRRGNDGGKYCVLFDPLDGSSNLDTGVGVGTIFSILRNDPNIPDAQETVCQPGAQQVAALIEDPEKKAEAEG